MLYKDINLIPQRKSGITPTRVLIAVLLIFTLGSYFGTYFVYEPLKARNEKRQELADLNARISAYGDIANEYFKARDEYNEYVVKTDALKGVLKNEFPTTDEIRAFVFNCPEGVTIDSFAISAGFLSIKAFALNYERIGDYFDALNSVEYFNDIQYSSIVLSQRDNFIIVINEEGKEIEKNVPIEGYSFTFSIDVSGGKE